MNEGALGAGHMAPSILPVQMSIRMRESNYLQFRALCAAMRRTNGEMLSEMIEVYLADTAA